MLVTVLLIGVLYVLPIAVLLFLITPLLLFVKRLLQHDAFSMFDDLSPGFESAVVSWVTLFAIAEAVGKVKDHLNSSDTHVLFVLFHGVSALKCFYVYSIYMYNWMTDYVFIP